jgi:putative transposase
MRRRFSEAQILGLLRAAATATPVMDLFWKHCFSRSTFRARRKRYGEAIAVGSDLLRALELENARLRKALAHRLSAIKSRRRVSPAYGGDFGTDEGGKPALPGRPPS